MKTLWVLRRLPGQQDIGIFESRAEATRYAEASLGGAKGWKLIEVAPDNCPYGRSHRNGPCSACTDS